MSTKITIDPVTRIEGHLKIDVEIENGHVIDAWSSGTLFRGIEIILKDRNPEDAWLFTQRVCGVCTYVHGSTSVKSVENAISLTIPDNARIIRNLLMGGQYLHDHVVHFYHLHALDWIDIISALNADPVATADLANFLSPDAPAIDFAETKSKLKTFAESGQLGPFANGYWGHAVYHLTPEENLLFAAHYLYALREQAKIARLHAIFGGKNPHLQSIRVGGVTCDREINDVRLNEFLICLNEVRHFIDTVYKPDVEFLATKYRPWGTIGGFPNYLVYGEFPLDQSPANLFIPSGVIWNEEVHNVQAVDPALITEHVQHSWYEGQLERHPAVGETMPSYTGYDPSDRYSWLKAPRYNGEPMEVGPLARVLVSYGYQKQPFVSLVNNFLSTVGLGLPELHSALGRIAARMLETKAIADAMATWLQDLSLTGETFIPPVIPMETSGAGFNEAPRGALGHWIQIRNQKIANYQMVVPSTWNLGPRCKAGKRGPLEKALIGTQVADAAKPVEILRIIHSFDPCLACAVHVIDTESDQTYTVQVVS